MIDPNDDIVPTLRMFNGLMMNKAADEIEQLRSSLSVTTAQLQAAQAERDAALKVAAEQRAHAERRDEHYQAIKMANFNLAAEAESNAKDAERYRFLECNAVWTLGPDNYKYVSDGWRLSIHLAVNTNGRSMAFNEAVDTAMAEGERSASQAKEAPRNG